MLKSELCRWVHQVIKCIFIFCPLDGLQNENHFSSDEHSLCPAFPKTNCASIKKWLLITDQIQSIVCEVAGVHMESFVEIPEETQSALHNYSRELEDLVPRQLSRSLK